MKTAIKSVALTSVLALGLMSGNVMAQTGANSSVSPQVHGRMMQGQGGMGMMQGRNNMGMMGGKRMMMQGKMGCMRMMGQGMGCNMMGGGMMKNMSAENQQKFMDATREMRRKMHEMNFDHMEAMRNPETSLEDLAAMEEEMLNMRKKIMKKAERFQDLQ